MNFTLHATELVFLLLLLYRTINIERKLDNMAGELDDLTTEVSNNTTVEKSALALIQGFSARLAAAGTDPTKLKALRDSLKANDDELAAAVAANTSAA